MLLRKCGSYKIRNEVSPKVLCKMRSIVSAIKSMQGGSMNIPRNMAAGTVARKLSGAI